MWHTVVSRHNTSFMYCRAQSGEQAQHNFGSLIWISVKGSKERSLSAGSILQHFEFLGKIGGSGLPRYNMQRSTQNSMSLSWAVKRGYCSFGISVRAPSLWTHHSKIGTLFLIREERGIRAVVLWYCMIQVRALELHLTISQWKPVVAAPVPDGAAPFDSIAVNK